MDNNKRILTTFGVGHPFKSVR